MKVAASSFSWRCKGSGIFKALARGADDVMLGRATFYGASAAGEAGASRAIAVLEDELVRTMQLSGVRQATAIELTAIFKSS